LFSFQQLELICLSSSLFANSSPEPALLSLYPQQQGEPQKAELQPIQQHEEWETAEWGKP